jgi:hypothetical protein
MASITNVQRDMLVSLCNVGPLEAAHLKTVLDAIDGSQVVSTTFRLDNLLFQLKANGWIGEQDATLIKAAVVAAAAGTPLNDAGTIAKTKAAVRKLKAVLPSSVVEGVAAVIFT